MLRMTKQADYAIVLLTRMASEPESQFNASEIAEQTGLPQPIVSKILKLLTRRELLTSHRGAKGGYRLAHTAGDITVAQIIEAVEGPIAITECVDENPGECSQEPVCPVRSNWQQINFAVRNALEQITLEEMTQPAAPTLVKLGSGSLEPAIDLLERDHARN
jgi:FeS assembly SUF system regulator